MPPNPFLDAIPQLSVRPRNSLRGLDADNPAHVAGFVGATSKEGGYPSKTTPKSTPSTEKEIERDIMLFTMVFGNAKPSLEHIIRNRSKSDPPVDKKKLSALCSKFRNAMCTPISSSYFELLVQEIIALENLEVGIWNAGIEIRTLREKNPEHPEAAKIEANIHEAQTELRRQCNKLLDTVDNITPNTTQVDPATWTAQEKVRVRALRARFGSMPASMDPKKEPTPAPRLRYQDRPSEDRVVFWARDHLVMFDMLDSWLGFAYQAFDLKANLTVPEIRAFLINFWSHAVDAHYMRLLAFQKEQKEWVRRGAQAGLEEAGHKALFQVKKAYVKYVEGLPREYSEWCERRIKKKESALPLLDLDKILVKPGSRGGTV